jgi:hypothetical protein
MSHYRQFKAEGIGYSAYKASFDGSGVKRWGGPEPAAYQPPPAPPTATENAAEYAAAMPTIYKTQLEYQPQFAAMSQALAQQMNPKTFALQENMAGQATDMMSAGAPQKLQDEWASNMRAQLGSNVSSPIGADAYSTGLMNYQEQYKNQGRQLGLSLAGRQQLIQPPQIAEAMGGYNVGQQMGIGAQQYGAGLGYSSSIMNSQNALAGANYGAQMGLYGDAFKGISGGLGSYYGR